MVSSIESNRASTGIAEGIIDYDSLMQERIAAELRLLGLTLSVLNENLRVNILTASNDDTL
jgi:hypothetical protein